MYDISKQELKNLLTFLEYKDEIQISINRLYLIELIELALESVD